MGTFIGNLRLSRLVNTNIVYLLTEHHRTICIKKIKRMPFVAAVK